MAVHPNADAEANVQQEHEADGQNTEPYATPSLLVEFARIVATVGGDTRARCTGAVAGNAGADGKVYVANVIVALIAIRWRIAIRCRGEQWSHRGIKIRVLLIVVGVVVCCSSASIQRCVIHVGCVCCTLLIVQHATDGGIFFYQRKYAIWQRRGRKWSDDGPEAPDANLYYGNSVAPVLGCLGGEKKIDLESN